MSVSVSLFTILYLESHMAEFRKVIVNVSCGQARWYVTYVWFCELHHGFAWWAVWNVVYS